MNKRIIGILIACAAVVLIGAFAYGRFHTNTFQRNGDLSSQAVNEGGPEPKPHPLSIEALRQGEYPGSDIVIEQTISPGSNYQRYIASYKSEGLKIYGLLTVPNPTSGSGQAEERGWPTIVFNHGYISPAVYRTTEKYVAFQDAFARAGYVTFKPDFRGHGNSEGVAQGGYGSNDYTIDVLNALASIKKFEGVDPARIGMWGHSMGGHVTLEAMVVSRDIKAGVIWAGVVGSYEDLFERWRRRTAPAPPGNTASRRGRWRQELAEQYGEPSQNPEFWNSLSATTYITDISGPVQLQHGTADSSVPLEFSVRLADRLKAAGKEVELITYDGDDHNLSGNLRTALNRSVEFFDRYLKI
jgi:dipeptidyl aminopeptidase/acylaminoacyl peptidase